jgi:uncharacterized protein (DUF885 family)
LTQRFATLLVSALLPFSASFSGAQTADLASREAHLRTAISDEWQYELRTDPEMATYVGDPRFNDRLSDFSPAAYAARLAHARHELAIFQSISPDGFSGEELLNRILMIRRLKVSIEGARFKSWEMPIDQMNGIHLEYASFPKQMPFHTGKDYENYLARLRAIPQAFDQITADMQLGLSDHLMPPGYLLEKAGAECQNIADKSPEQSPFAQPLVSFPQTVSPDDQKRLRQQILAAIQNDVNPAYAKLADFVRTQYAPHGRKEYGIWALPDGDARYRWEVAEQTTTSLTPAQIHQMGLAQVAGIEAQMLKLANSLGYKDLGTFNRHIRDDRQLYGKSSQQIFDLYQHYTDQMQAKLPLFFGKLPKNRLEVVPMDAFRAPDAVPADYSPGTANGSRPGRINVNEYDPQHRLLLNVEAIAYHEGIPGHHLQFSIAQELPDVPAFRRFASYNAYSEGWAFYAERLGREMGFYQDPYSEYGRLENEMWRSVRLVVDTGVHSQHWSRQQMVDFFRAHTAMDDPNIQTEVDRYIAWPGQALAYKLGQMTILNLREQARTQLGPTFDIRRFHDAVLEEGPLPLDILQTRLTRWIQQQKTAAGRQ